MQGVLDENLYSRQLYVLGKEAMVKMMNSHVLIIGLNGLGQEIIKNVCLAGVNTVLLHDASLIEISDLCTGFYFTIDSIGERKDRAIIQKVKELNPYVNVVQIDKLTEDIFNSVNVVVLCGRSIDEQIEINKICRANKIFFIGCQERGVFSQVFCDFGEGFTIIDTTGEPAHTGIFNDIQEDGVATVIDGTRHNLESGDIIKIYEAEEYENKMFKVEVISAMKLKLIKLDDAGNEISNDKTFIPIFGGLFEQQKLPKTIDFIPMSQAIEDPEILITDFEDMNRAYISHRCFLILSEFNNNKKRYPICQNKEDSELFYEMYKQKFKNDDSEELVKLFCLQSSGSMMPVCSVIGGFVAQEVLKACSSKFQPLHQFLYFDCLQVLPKNIQELRDNEFERSNTRYDPLIALFGKSNLEKLLNLRIFLVGSGAIGCEHIKNFAMMGMGSKGQLFITDMDAIEQSNLNRQFLFKQKDVSLMKARVAGREAINLNPDFNNGRILSYELKVGEETENVFSDKFLTSLNFVANALDNIEARKYIDSRCILTRRALFESGTLGTKGNTQVIIPYLTESYGSSQDPPEQSIPLCTIRNFPHLVEHTIEWALSEFKSNFDDKINSIMEYLSGGGECNPALGICICGYCDLKSCQCRNECSAIPCTNTGIKLEGILSEDSSISTVVKGISNMNGVISGDKGMDAVIRGEKIIKEGNGVENVNALERIDEDNASINANMIGDDIHDLIRNAPRNLEDCIQSAISLFINLFYTSIKKLILTFPPDHVTSEGLPFWSPPRRPPTPIEFDITDPLHLLFVISASNLYCYTYGINGKVTEDMIKKCNYTGVIKQGPLNNLQRVEFEKDDDTNHHIDFIYSCSSLRAINYKIKPTTRLAVKGIAGKIIPAIATTTALISGLSVIEMIKYTFLSQKRNEEYIIEKDDLSKFKNSFVALSLPFFGSSEPIPPQPEKYYFKENEIHEFTIWERIEFEDIKLKEIIQHFKDKYDVNVEMITINSSVVFSSFYNPDKYKKNLNKKVSELVGKSEERIYVILEFLFDSECDVFPSVIVRV
ncbi:Ubiquitin-activating enzyme E1 1 [Astathelohania contejeani]|uniref:Ubiquitin-activating enzyme E1 1 n=1 Tax=Astathelohania contejeani TaxID=164912 RepID=A0ABQ7I2N7_9MICR|nr:Ubiquitin-activating enzyme E1 1 [Thelohania contejeani]